MATAAGVVSGQAFYYQIPVGANTPELNASVLLADNPNNPFQAELVDPNGVAESTTSNVSINGNNNTKNDALGAQLHALNPAAGTWTLVVAYLPTVSGTTLSEPFTVSTNESKVPVSATGLPTAPKAGQAQTVQVQVTNNGTSPESYFIDGRLPITPTTPPLKLTAQDAGGGATTVPLSVTSNIPSYLVPTDTTGFSQSATTTGATPIEFDSNQGQGDPDIESGAAGTTATSSFVANPVTPGFWGDRARRDRRLRRDGRGQRAGDDADVRHHGAVRHVGQLADR